MVFAAIEQQENDYKFYSKFDNDGVTYADLKDGTFEDRLQCNKKQQKLEKITKTTLEDLQKWTKDRVSKGEKESFLLTAEENKVNADRDRIPIAIAEIATHGFTLVAVFFSMIAAVTAVLTASIAPIPLLAMTAVAISAAMISKFVEKRLAKSDPIRLEKILEDDFQKFIDRYLCEELEFHPSTTDQLDETLYSIYANFASQIRSTFG